MKTKGILMIIAGILSILGVLNSIAGVIHSASAAEAVGYLAFDALFIIIGSCLIYFGMKRVG